MRNIEVLQPEMLERELGLHDFGFVSIKLSRKWMAKSVHKMLKDGIDTQAPELLMENVLVKFPSYNTDLMLIDLVRCDLITRTLFNMLEYSKNPMKFSMPPDEHPIKEKDDGVLVFCNAEEELEIHVKRDGCCGDLVNDLTDLWYGLKKEKADWIVCVTPVHQNEYIKACIKLSNFTQQPNCITDGNMLRLIFSPGCSTCKLVPTSLV
ncbi:hypothetical protein Tco_0799789 [Tanacetum coccineum]|uniref:Uncharacterized protein n=1 Tax=Tanacetum coccineum TaxID=301880 RepID=A0ABQ4ZTZ0_9ASTR